MLKGHKILPFANETYKVGQVLEEYSKPRKLVITIDPIYRTSDIIEGRGVDISVDTTDSFDHQLTAKINKLFTGEAKVTGETKYVASYINTRVQTIPKDKLFKRLKAYVRSNKDEAELIKLQQQEGIHHSTVTSLVIADVMITKTNSYNNSTTLSDFELKKLNANLGAKFTSSGKGTYVTKGASLPVAMYSSPDLMKKVSPHFVPSSFWKAPLRWACLKGKR